MLKTTGAIWHSVCFVYPHVPNVAARAATFLRTGPPDKYLAEKENLMKRNSILFLSLVFAVAAAFAVVGDAARAADGVPEAYGKIASIEQELFAKQNELNALYNAATPDAARAQQLFRDIGELRGQLFAAESELRAQAGSGAAPYAGMHHPGEFSGYDGYGCMGMGMGMGRGMGRGFGRGHHGGW